jgi:hypothetical protein
VCPWKEAERRRSRVECKGVGYYQFRSISANGKRDTQLGCLLGINDLWTEITPRNTCSITSLPAPVMARTCFLPSTLQTRPFLSVPHSNEQCESRRGLFKGAFFSDGSTIRGVPRPLPYGRFRNFFSTVGRAPWTGERRGQTSMPRVGFEPTIPVSERSRPMYFTVRLQYSPNGRRKTSQYMRRSCRNSNRMQTSHVYNSMLGS